MVFFRILAGSLRACILAQQITPAIDWEIKNVSQTCRPAQACIAPSHRTARSHRCTHGSRDHCR